MITKTLQLLEDWITSVSGEVVKSKQICFQSLQDVIQVAITIFPVYLHQPGKKIIQVAITILFSYHCY